MSLFHRHRWRIVACQPGTYAAIGPIGEGDVTMILYHCECGQNRSDDIPGHWTYQQLTGTQHAARRSPDYGDFGEQLAAKGGPVDRDIERRIIEEGG